MAAIILSAVAAVLFFVLSCLDGTPNAAIHLAAGFGFSAPDRWYFNVLTLLALLTLALAGWLPAYQEPTVDWQHEKRSRKLRELFAEETTFESNPLTGEVIKREKTLAEVSLERALAQAEAELQAERRGTGQHTVSQSQIQIAIAATINTSPPADRPGLRAFTERLFATLDAQHGRD